VLVIRPEDAPSELTFDAIWSNPPIRVGKVALHEMLAMWLSRLAATASAHLVVQRHLGADSLAAWLKGEGWEVRRRAARQGYRLLDVGRSAPG